MPLPLTDVEETVKPKGLRPTAGPDRSSRLLRRNGAHQAVIARCSADS